MENAIKRTLIVGETGSGKTVSLATLLHLGTVAVWDADEQAEKVRGFAALTKADPSRLTVEPINPAAPREYKRVRARVREYRQDKVRADFVVIDSITSLYDMCLTEGRELSGESDPGELSWDGGYRSAADHYDILISELFGIPCKAFIATGHLNEEYDKKGNFVKVSLAAPGRKKVHLPRRFGAILTAQATTRAGVTTYTWESRPSVRRIVRAPWAGFPDSMEQDFRLLFGQKV